MPGAYTVAYIFQDYDGYAAYLYNGNRDDHHGDYEHRVYQNATTINHVFNGNYEIGLPYTMNDDGFFAAEHGHNYFPNAQAPAWWRVFKSWLVGPRVRRAMLAIALAYFFKKALKRRAVGGR